MPASASAPHTSVRRCAAKVSTWAIIPPYVKTSGGSQRASTNVSSSRPSSTIERTWLEERRPDVGELGADVLEGLGPLGVDVVRAVVSGGVPHGQLADQPRRAATARSGRRRCRRPRSRPGASSCSGQRCRARSAARRPARRGARPSGSAGPSPSTFLSCRDPQATGRVEVHLARRVEPEARRPAPPDATAPGRTPALNARVNASLLA